MKIHRTTLGTDLNQMDRSDAIHLFTNRYTREFFPMWAAKERATTATWPVQFLTDQEWLENTLFHVAPSGSLDKRHRECDSTPTWPDNPELRDKPRCVWAYHGINLRYPNWKRHYDQWDAAQMGLGLHWLDLSLCKEYHDQFYRGRAFTPPRELTEADRSLMKEHLRRIEDLRQAIREGR